MEAATATVAEIVRDLTPWDALERQHVEETLSWLAKTDDIFRRVKPATPPRHLVSYVALIDPDERAVLLGMHRKAGLWLPTGGHVDPGEHPLATARRETREEIAIEPEFTVVGESPLFLTITTTVGIGGGHEDVSLWYVIRGSRHHDYTLDPTEFTDHRWFPLEAPAPPATDPHLERFLAKLTAALDASPSEPDGHSMIE
ncbi:NUDIX domain-containing protein [Nocardia sp. SYP-A9097]|uniref:NUDIX hydrolase n=1 Tax=Nocardia sp. SYP-A9097 TaxID=2663237 RepID=UPI00129B5A08|nr:NUDIX domain-containing protein [Nocardia sp. SYP-A9097]MRH89785.1 NUDIX domain-containing protein [Nocardia sp. SYP-A9097]